MIFNPANGLFRPVRIVTTTNQTYDIYHPDLLLVAQRFLVVGTPSSEDPSLADLVTRVALVRVTELRDRANNEPAGLTGSAPDASKVIYRTTCVRSEERPSR